MDNEDNQYSIVEYMSDHSGYKCGYCKSLNTNFSHGMWAHRLSTIDYQHLINRGWRRSGKYCYKPTMDKTCCPHYTIKCDALNFKPSRSQKKVLKRMHKFLSFGKSGCEETQCFQKDQSEAFENERKVMELCKVVEEKSLANNLTGDELRILRKETDSGKSKLVSTRLTSDISIPESSIMPPAEQIIQGPDPSRPLRKKAKLIRQENRKAKVNSDASNKPKQKNQEKTLQDFLNEPLPENPAHRLELRLVPSTSSDKSFQLFKRYQTTIHNEREDEWSENSYESFLVQSPTRPWKPAQGPPAGYGSFHQHYLLDGELIAVGVIDILPSCVSSVYLYYDPEYSFLSLGTYSSLRELALVKKLSETCPSLKWYYMGYYIHSCPKMRYKGNYFPSYLLCPEKFTWQTIEKCIPKLDVNKYSRLNDDGTSLAEEQLDYKRVLCLYEGSVMPYGIYMLKMNQELEDDVKEYCAIVGSRLAYTLLLCRN